MSEVVYAVPEFSGKNISVVEAAKIMGKDQQFVRQAMIQGVIDIGTAFKKEGSSQYDFYISPYKFWQYTGYIHRD